MLKILRLLIIPMFLLMGCSRIHIVRSQNFQAPPTDAASTDVENGEEEETDRRKLGPMPEAVPAPPIEMAPSMGF